jgi:hypothetical protein
MERHKLLVALTPNYNPSVDEFIEYWKSQYNYPRMELYNNNIILQQLDLPNLRELYEWKNGMKLSSAKSRSLTKIAAELPLINHYKMKGIDQVEFNKRFDWMSTVWKVYLMHIISPTEYPIFDQHVYRAFCYLQKQVKEDSLGTNKQKETIYYEHYIHFYGDFKDASEKFNEKEIDSALWAFGKFLSMYPNMIAVHRKHDSIV